MRHLLPLVLASSLACGLEPASPLSSKPAAITDGSEDSGHPAIAKLIFSLSGGTAQDGACTATLVGQRTVLSAAHCLIYPNTELALDDGQRFVVSRTVVHPDYVASKPYLYDLGLALLAQAPPVRPLALDLRRPQPGTVITLVGYGRSAAALNDQGIKRLAQNTIASVEPGYLTIVGTGDGVGNACHGDSGGPLLLEVGGEEAVLGLLSYITDYSTCGTTTYASRLDLFGEWLQTEAAGDLLLIDTEPPQVTFLSPADGEAVQARLTVELQISDDHGVAEVALLVDGQEQRRVSAGPFSFPLTLERGEHQLQALAWDEAGNQGQQTITVRVGSAAGEEGCHLAAASLPESCTLALLLLLLGASCGVSRRRWRLLRCLLPTVIALALFPLSVRGDHVRGAALAGPQAEPGALFPPAQLRGPHERLRGPHERLRGPHERLRGPHERRGLWPWVNRSFVQLHSRPGLRVRSPRTAWGTPLLVRRLQELGDTYTRSFPAAPPISIHDISLRQGGRLPLHASHREGLDVDIRLPLLRDAGYVDATPLSLDRARTWFIIQRLVQTCDVEFILLDRQLQQALHAWALERGYSCAALAAVLEYPKPPTSPHPTRPDDAVVRHFRRHANHLHVRFRASHQPLRMRAAQAACRHHNLALAP